MESFIKISLSVWAVEMTQTHTHTHTHIHIHSQTDTLGSIATCSVKLTEYKQDRSRRCQNIQSIDTFFYGKYRSNRQNIIKCVIYGSDLVETDTILLQLTSNILFLAAILSFFRKRG